MPDGYDTVIGERGYDLSGGQRQRVSIARLLVTDPAILILDDATSSVDVHIEQEIHDALRGVMVSRTTLVIAHRLSTINLADRVVLMERGRIIASGSHAELMAAEPRYAEVLAHLEEDEAVLRERRAEVDGNGKSCGRAGTARARDRFDGEWRADARGSLTRRGMFGPGGGRRRRDVLRRPRTSAAAGLPFAGIPPELHDLAEKILATEPEHGSEEVSFERIPPDDRPFTLRRFLAPHRWWLIGSFLFVVIETVASQAGPRLTAIAVDNGILRGNFRVITVVAAIYMVSVLFAGVAGRIRLAWTGRVGERLMFHLRVRIFTHLQRLGLDFYTREKAGAL